MAVAGWYPDATAPGTLRWWDGMRWTEHTAPGPATTTLPAAAFPATPFPATPPPVRGRVRPDGTPRGMAFRTAALLVAAGVAAMVIAAVQVVPAFLDSVDGPRLAIPGSDIVQLDRGTWVVYVNGFVTLTPGDVRVEGPGQVDVMPRRIGFSETVTRGNTIYTGTVRLEVEVSGDYQVTVAGEPSTDGEILIARPLSGLFSEFPWIIAFALGAIMAVVGLAAGVLGAGNRRAISAAG